MNEFENKGIEKFFKSKLNTSNQNTDWASPPDFIFEKAIDRVNEQEKERKRKLFIWIGFFSFVAMFSVIIISQGMQISNVKKSLDKLEGGLMANTIEQPVYTKNREDHPKPLEAKNTAETEEIHTEKASQISSLQLSPEKTKQSFTSKNLSQFNSNQHLKNNLNQETVDQNNFILSDHNKTGSQENLIKKNQIFSSPGIKQHSSLIAHSDSSREIFETQLIRNKYHVTNINSIKQLAFELRYSKLSVNPKFEVFKEDNSNFNSAYTLSLTTGINSASLSMNNMSSLHNQELTNYDKYYLGSQSELALLYQITNRFSTGLQLNYSKINNKSTFTENSKLDLANMTFENGKMNYAMPMDIFTPLGSHKMNSDIILDENLNPSNLITNVSEINQSFNSIGIGLTARYSIIQNTKFSSFIGASFSHHIFNNPESELNTTLSMKDEVMKNFASNPKKMYNDKKSYHTIQAQIGLEYKITDRTNLLFQTSVGKSTNSLRETFNQIDTKTFIQYINSGIGISYSL